MKRVDLKSEELMKGGLVDLLMYSAVRKTSMWIWGQLTVIDRTAELSSGKWLLDQPTVIHMVGLPSGYMNQTDWMNPARLKDQRRTLLLPCSAEKTCFVEKGLHQLLEVGGNPMAGVADAVAPWDLVVPFLAVAGTDSAAIVEGIQADLSVSPLSGEMQRSPTALVVGLPCSVEETPSAVMIKMTRMVDDPETASFESQTD